MAGFFGLFGKKTKYIDDSNEDTSAQDPQNNLDDFFLNDDDAKSLGNLEWMRSSSAKVPPQNGTSAQAKSKEESSTNSENPRADSDVELWRAMARKMKR